MQMIRFYRSVCPLSAVSLSARLCSASVLFSSAARASNDAEVADSKELVKGAPVEVCFVLDTTGSMSGMIEGAKRKIWSIANEISNSESEPSSIRFGLVGYRDRGDEYVIKKTALTDDLDLVHTELMGFQAGGGGDGPESVNQALNEAVTTMQWSEGEEINRIVFLVGDAPPHMDYQDDVSYMKSGEIAQSKGIVINTILCGNGSDAMKHWKKICELTQGGFAQIEQNGGAVIVSCPQDQKIKELTLELNDTVCLYGDKNQRERGSTKLKAVGKSSFEANASRAAYQSKNFKGKVISGNEDLVDEWKNGNVKLEEIDEKQLPVELSKLSTQELEEKLKATVTKRAEIQKQLDALNLSRSKHLSELAEKAPEKGKEPAFDKAIKEMLEVQIK